MTERVEHREERRMMKHFSTQPKDIWPLNQCLQSEKAEEPVLKT